MKMAIFAYLHIKQLPLHENKQHFVHSELLPKFLEKHWPARCTQRQHSKNGLICNLFKSKSAYLADRVLITDINRPVPAWKKQNVQKKLIDTLLIILRLELCLALVASMNKIKKDFVD